MEVVWRAFELRPEPVPTLDPAGEYLTRVWQGSVYPMAKKLGIEMRLPPVQPRSRKAHQAAKWAGERFEDFNKELFRAFFERGEDIGRADVLVEIARKLALDSQELVGSLENDEFLEDVLEDEALASELGITGVPAFVADRRAGLVGVQTSEALVSLTESVRT